jgi:hypothetical protein
MAAAAIEIHDAGLVAIREGGAAPSEGSPGYALFDGGTLLTGRAARRLARQKPRATHTKFWDPLDLSPLPRPFPPKFSRADLAHAQLNAVYRELGAGVDEVLLLVPGWFSSEELGLLLGIANASEIPVAAMVDLALAAALAAESESVIYLDIHLHRVAGARVGRDASVERSAVASSDGAGLVPLENAWAALLAQKFLRETRFDPLHAAASEQALYDRMPGLLDALRDEEEAELEIETGGKTHSIGVSREEIVRAALPYYRKLAGIAESFGLAGGGKDQLLLSPPLAALPGIVELLARDVSGNSVSLPPGAAALSALAYRDRLPRRKRSEGLSFVTRWPLRAEEEAPTPPLAGPPSTGTPTHVLYRGVAHAIDPPPFLIGVAIPDGHRGLNLSEETGGISRHHVSLHRAQGRLLVEDHSRYGTYLNGERVEREAKVRAGDKLRLGTPGVEVQLIEVKS